MDDYAFQILQIKAAVTPQKEAWPSGDVQVSIMGAKPTIKGALYWSALHDAVSTARDRVTKVYAETSAIDDDRSFSREGKDRKKQELTTKAIADLKRSKALDKARASVEHQLAKWNDELGLKPKRVADVGDAIIRAEIRSHLAALKADERMAFIDTHASEVADAVLTAPGFLSGLSPAELNVVKQRIEARANPEIAEAKAQALKALEHTESGWRAAIEQISERGGLPKDRNGAEDVG